MVLSPFCFAKNSLRYGFNLGLGGAGLSDTVKISGVPTVVQKSEGPGVGSVYVDNLISDDFSYGFECAFGYRFSPFTSGVSFTGLTSRWYVWGPALSEVSLSPEKTTLFSKRYAYFYGLGAGIASASINRRGEAVENLTGSGLYFGPKLGADYSYSKKMSFRYEFQYYSTFLATSKDPTLTEFALQFGVFYFY